MRTRPNAPSPKEDYTLRVVLCLDTLPGKDLDRAVLLNVDPSQVCRWRKGQAVGDPQALADAAGVDVGLLVFGPTTRLKVLLQKAEAERKPAPPAKVKRRARKAS